MQNVELLWPEDRVPVSIIVDDPTPCRNPCWYEFPDQGYVAEVPNSFLERFADVLDRTGVLGKFTVVPCPGAQGCIDTSVRGIDRAELEEFISTVKTRIEPRWDITPELMSHNRAVDLETLETLDLREDEWVREQDEEMLVRYISRALQILRNVGLEPNGVTSPWSTGIEIEETYGRAVARALRDVCGVKLAWYFVHCDDAPYVPPRIMQIDPAAGTALVSIVTGTCWDYLWFTQNGEPPNMDPWITADGQSGRLVELFHGGGPVVPTVHWQSLFSNGSGAGLDGLEEIVDRMQRHWGERMRWIRTSELARYWVARETVKLHPEDEGRSIRFEAPFECSCLTFRLPLPRHVAELGLDGSPLRELPEDAIVMPEGSWRRDGEAAVVCVPLTDGMRLQMM